MTFASIVSFCKRTWRSAVLAGIFGTGIRVGANLLLLPIVLFQLTQAEYAIWCVFVSLGGFASLADFGFGSTIPRVYNYLLAGADDFDAEGLREAKPGGEPNYAGISRVNASVRFLYLGISMAALCLLAIFGTLSLLKPAAGSGGGNNIWWIWAAFVAATGYNLATFHWALALQGLNRMRDLQVVYIIGGLSYAATAAVLLILHCGLLSMVIATFVKGFIMHGRCRQIFHHIVPRPDRLPRADWHIVRKLWPNTYKFGIVGLGGYCMFNANFLICSQLFNKDVIGSYGLTMQIGGFANAFAGLWLVVKWPEIAMLRAQGRVDEMASLFARRLSLVMLSFIAIALLVLFAGNPLLAWKGSHTQLLPGPYLVLYLVYLAQGLLCVQFGMLAYTENVVPFVRVSLYTGLGVIFSSLILTPIFGLWGLLAAPLLTEQAYNFWYTVRRGFRGQPFTPRQFVLAAFGFAQPAARLAETLTAPKA